MSATAPPERLSSGFRRTFEALDIPAYRILWFGTLFSFLGMQMQVIARGYLAYDLTGRNTALGGVMIAFGVPQLLLSLHGGVVADRVAKRKVLIAFQTVLALGSGLMALAIALGVVEYWMLIASGVITGASFAFVGPARQAFIGDLVPDHMLGNAVVLQQANMNGTRVIGPAVAGALIATPLIGMAGVYTLTTIGFIITAVTMFRLPAGEPRPRANRGTAMGDTAELFRYVRRNRPLAILLLTSFMVVMLAFPYQGFLASMTAEEFGRGAGGLGALSSLAAVGALLATLTVASLTGHRYAWRMQVGAGIAFGLALIAFGYAPSFTIGLIVIFFLGAFASAFQSLNNSLSMTITDQRYYGRVQSLMNLSWSLFGIISLPLGIVADQIGIRATLALMGAAAVAAIVVLEVISCAVCLEGDILTRRAAFLRHLAFKKRREQAAAAADEAPRPAGASGRMGR